MSLISVFRREEEVTVGLHHRHQWYISDRIRTSSTTVSPTDEVLGTVRHP